MAGLQGCNCESPERLDEGETIQTIINVERDHSQDSYLFFTIVWGSQAY